jgi:quercetin dioxygenase-like cupin family protein
MGIYRMYTGEDGQTHIEETSLDSRPELAEAVKATTITFTEHEAGRFVDWHPAPCRQYVICISGQIEIGLGDGSTHLFGPGDARLVEDTTGQGHTTKTAGTGPGVTCTIPLA